MTYYTAIGTYRIRNENGVKFPFIQKMGRYYPISIPEFCIWSCLAFNILTRDELQHAYSKRIGNEIGMTQNFDEMLSILIDRKLVVKGEGITGEEALLNMLNEDVIVTKCQKDSRKGVKSISQVIFLPRMERRLEWLLNRMPLCVSEIIRCIDLRVKRWESPNTVLKKIYPNEQMTSIREEACKSPLRMEVIQGLCNLYLCGYLTFEII